MGSVPYPKTINVFKRGEGKGAPVVWGAWSERWLESLKGLEWVFYEKVDGTNIRVEFHPDGSIRVLGRSNRAQLPPGLEDNIRGSIGDRRPDVQQPIVIYGEGFGPGIQGKEGLAYGGEKRFIAFDVAWFDPEVDANQPKIMNHEGAKVIAESVGLEWVPEIHRGSLESGALLVRGGLQSVMREGFAEGLIARPPVTLYTNSGAVVKCKLKHRDLYMEAC